MSDSRALVSSIEPSNDTNCLDAILKVEAILGGVALVPFEEILVVADSPTGKEVSVVNVDDDDLGGAGGNWAVGVEVPSPNGVGAFEDIGGNAAEPDDFSSGFAENPKAGFGAVLERGGYELLADAGAFTAPNGVGEFKDIVGKNAEFATLLVDDVDVPPPNGVGAFDDIGGNAAEPDDFSSGVAENPNDGFPSSAPKGVRVLFDSGALKDEVEELEAFS